MGIKFSDIETIGELRLALANIPDDVPFRVITEEDEEYSKADVQSLYDGQPEMFVLINVSA